MTDDLAEDPVLGIRSRFSRRVTDDGTEVLDIETWVDPGGGVTPHVHPGMEERFDVIAGTMQFLSGRRWTDCHAGETAVVPPGTRHAFRNRSESEARMVCHATPPSSLQEFLEDAAAMSRAGAITSRALPASFDGLLRAAVLAETHKDMVTLLAPLPPPFIQRLVLPPLAKLGAKRGYSPGHLG